MPVLNAVASAILRGSARGKETMNFLSLYWGAEYWRQDQWEQDDMLADIITDSDLDAMIWILSGFNSTSLFARFDGRSYDSEALRDYNQD